MNMTTNTTSDKMIILVILISIHNYSYIIYMCLPAIPDGGILDSNDLIMNIS